MLSKIFLTFKTLYSRYRKNDVPSAAAQLSYYLLLSFFPFLIFLLSLAKYAPLSDSQVLIQLSSILPESTYKITVLIIEEILIKSNNALLSSGMLWILWLSSNPAMALFRSINKAYNLKEIRPLWLIRFYSLVYTIGIALVIIVVIVMIIFGRILGRNITDALGIPVIFSPLYNIMSYIIAFISCFTVFSTLYYLMPAKKIYFKNVIAGAAFSSILWTIASIGFSFYVNHFNDFSKLYGSIGGIIILLVWLYLSSIFILLGNELNAVLEK